MDVEVELAEGVFCPGRVRLGGKRIATEREQHAHRVGRAVRDRAIDVPRRHPALPAGAEGAFGEAKRLRFLAFVQKVMPGYVVEFGGTTRNIAALPAVVTGQPIEGGDRPVRLGRGQALPDPVPGVIGERWAFEEDIGGLVQIFFGYTGNLGDPFGRIVRGSVRKSL